MAMPNIFSLFSTPPAAPAPAAVNPNPAVPNPATIVPDGTGPTGIPAAGTGEKSPLENFAKLWENDPTKTPQPQPAMFSNDPEKLLAAARTIDFAKVIPAEVRAKIVGGGADAADAFSQAINAVSQQAYAQSAHATTKIVEAALAKQKEMLMAEIPNLVRKHSVSEKLREDNPLFSNPATAPMLKMFEDRLSLMHPTASAADLNTMAKQYLTEFAQVVTASNAATPAPVEKSNMTKTGAKGESWENFFAR